VGTNFRGRRFTGLISRKPTSGVCHFQCKLCTSGGHSAKAQIVGTRDIGARYRPLKVSKKLWQDDAQWYEGMETQVYLQLGSVQKALPQIASI
jgi:hypothetical protein